MNSMVPIQPTVELVKAALTLAGCEKWDGFVGTGWEVVVTGKDILVVMHRANTARGQSELLWVAAVLAEHWKLINIKDALYVYLRTDEPEPSRWKMEVLRAKLEMSEGRRIDLEEQVKTLTDRLSLNPPASWILATHESNSRQIESMTRKIPDLTQEIDKLKGSLIRIKKAIPARDYAAVNDLPYGSTVKAIIKIVKEALGD